MQDREGRKGSGARGLIRAARRAVVDSLSSIFRARPVAGAVGVVVRTARDFHRHSYLTYAGSLAFFFFLAMFPLFVFLAAALAYVPIPHLFDKVLDVLVVVAPPDAMGVVRGIVHDVTARPGELLSIGIVGSVFFASRGFSAMITALNIAYDVAEGRPFWRKTLLAVSLTLLTGAGTVVALVSIVVGPRFGILVSTHLHTGWAFAAAWPYLQWLLITLTTVLSVELIYFVAPNVRQRFLWQIPGAMLAVVSWVVASWALDLYLQNFARYSRTFGAIGAVVGLMLWLYVSALAIILGAELNSELLKAYGARLVPRRAPRGRVRQTTKPTLKKSA